MNTLVTAQHNNGLQTTAQTQLNCKSLFSCELSDFKKQSFKKLPIDSIDETLLGFQNFTPVRKIRIAIVATGGYSEYHVNKVNAKNLGVKAQKQIVLNAIKRTLRNVNKILKRDLSVALVLVEENEKLIFLDAKQDKLSGTSAFVLISELKEIINKEIGEDNYDIGHAFTTRYGGLSSVGGAFGNRKSEGVTGAVSPEGKIFDIDFFAHEIGHQIGATHTQNSNCSRTSSSIEPGSGNTIMAYAGVCEIPNSNVSFSSSPYFHNYNILQIKDFLNTHFKNKNDVGLWGLNPINNYKIPKETPFEIPLKVNSNSGTEVWYSCNQIDTEIGMFPPTADQSKGPVFVAQELSKQSSIYFPELGTVLDGNYNSRKGVLSSVPRVYNFLASARMVNGDENLTSMRKFEVQVEDIAPFKVTSPNNENITWQPNENVIITWDVGETKSVLKQDFVEILLSINDGKSFDYILSKKTPNNGEAKVKVPTNIKSNKCRLKVKPLNSIFYSINKTRFSITSFQKSTYESNTPVDINPEAVSEIEIKDFITYEDLEVKVKLNHEDISELQISLVNPEGKEIMLWDQFCSQGSQLDVMFSDEAQKTLKKGLNGVSLICEAVVLGLKAPKDLLKDLQGDTEGLWQLKIINASGAPKTGILNHWGLHFIAKKNQEVLFNKGQKMTAFPIPAKEVLNIQFKDSSFAKSQLEIFTVAGDLKKRIPLGAGVIQQISVSDLIPGVYFLKVANDKVILNKKIVVE